MSKNRRWRRIAPLTASTLILVAALAITTVPLLLKAPGESAGQKAGPDAKSVVTLGASKTTPRRNTAIVTRFNLVDHHGKPVTEQTYAGRWKLVFFGFTHCPDVCPTALDGVAQVLEKLGQQGDTLVPLFISVDPQRDTPKKMATYVDAFDSRIVGLTGSEAAVAKAAKSFKAFYSRVSDKNAPDQYTVNHSSILYLMAPDGHFVTHFRHTEKPTAIAAAIKKELLK